VPGGYKLLDCGLDFDYVKRKYFSQMISESEWHFEPTLETEFPFRRYIMQYDSARRKHLFGYQQYYRAMSKFLFNGLWYASIYEYIYRITGFIYDNKPLFMDYNNDGIQVYDGRDYDQYVFPTAVRRYAETRITGGLGIGFPLDLQLARWDSPGIYQGFAKLVHQDRWKNFNFHISDTGSINITNPDNNIPNSPEIPGPFDPSDWQGNPFWFDNTEDTLRKMTRFKMDILKLAKLDLEEPLEQRKVIHKVSAESLFKQVMFSNNLVLVNDNEKVAVRDKTLSVLPTGQITYDVGKQSIDITGIDSPNNRTGAVLAKPIIEIYDDDTAGELLGTINVNGTLDVISTEPVYLKFDHPASRSVIVYYTLDGTEPVIGADGTYAFRTGVSPSARVELPEGLVIRAIATRSGATDSDLLDVKINFITLGQLPRPIINPEAGVFRNSVTVSIVCEDAEATIYYTLDGTTPDNTKTLYTAPIPISTTNVRKNVMVQAIAIRSAYDDSEVASKKYILYPTITITRDEIIEMDISNQIIDIQKLSVFSDNAYGDALEDFIFQFFESKLDTMAEIYNLIVDKRENIAVMDFIDIEREGVKMVTSIKTDNNSGLKHITCWDVEI
jgi:hypothetical protein